MIQKTPTLSDLQESVEKLASEVRKLRLALNYKKRSKPKQATITNPEWCYEYPSMTVDLTVEQWKNVRNGKKLSVEGRGYTLEEFNEDSSDLYKQDYWFFNDEYEGDVRVEIGIVTDRHLKEIAFRGSLSDCEIIETDAPKTIRKKNRKKPV